MKIDGKALAQKIVDSLAKRVAEIEEEGVTPHLAVILIGRDESSKAYVRQKELKIQEIGAAITVHRFSESFKEQDLLDMLKSLRDDATVHGIIVQRPLPPHIDGQKVTDATEITKDIDGFCTDSPFDPPIAQAVWKVLREVQKSSEYGELSMHDWLRRQRIVILGKGQTAGGPIIKFFKKRDVPLTIIDSQTPNRYELTTQADIMISAVGKPGNITKADIKEGATLIGVGMARGEDNKLHGDYEEEDIAEVAGYYTSVPGGVGPVNVAMLLSNLIQAAESV